MLPRFKINLNFTILQNYVYHHQCYQTLYETTYRKAKTNNNTKNV